MDISDIIEFLLSFIRGDDNRTDEPPVEEGTEIDVTDERDGDDESGYDGES